MAVVTKSFWKPLSANTIFVTNDNTTKRRDYEEQVMKVFYLTNVNTPQELQEIVTAVRSVADIQRLFVYNCAERHHRARRSGPHRAGGEDHLGPGQAQEPKWWWT